VRQLNPRNPSGHFSHRSYFFNVTRKPKVPAPFRFFCVFVNPINMNLPPVGIEATKLKRRSLAQDPYEQQHTEDFPPNGVWLVLFILNGIRLQL
jgi:hypothetical protein